MNKRSKKLFWKNVSVVFSGTVLAQIIPILGSLIIARLFIPEAFGQFAIWLSFVLMFSVICTGRYELSLSVESDGKPRLYGVAANLLVVIITSIISTLLISFFIFFSINFGITNIQLYLVVVSGGLMASLNIWQAWAAADGRFPQLSKMRIVISFAIFIFQVGVGFLIPSINTLILGQLAGVFIGILYSFYLSPLQSEYYLVRSYKKLANYLVKHRRFFIFSLPADSINSISSQLPILIIGAKYGADIAGFLAMTIRALGAPIGLLGRAVLDVFKRHASVAFRKNQECRDHYIQTFKVLTLMSISVMPIILLYSEELFTFAFGETWALSGTIAIWMLPMFLLRFVSSPLSYMFYLANKQSIDLVWQITLLLMTIITLYFASTYKYALIYYASGYSCLYVVYLFISYRLSCGDKKSKLINEE